ncbi:MAG: hypothetical protein GXP14_02920 [Gammaproteobacteria bacterium]|nr:hypothetical protein [Gammaproteobacteria bacterium]
MGLQQFIGILKAHIKIIFMTLFVAVTTAGVISFSLPQKFTSTATVLLDFRSSNPFGVGFSSILPEGFIGTQLETITSPKVARRVLEELDVSTRERLVRTLKVEKVSIIDSIQDKVKSMINSNHQSILSLDSKGDQHAKTIAQGDIQKDLWVVYGLLSNISVDLTRSTRLITLEYSSIDPELAMILANGFAEAYIVTNLEMSVDPVKRSSTWMNEHLEVLRSKLEKTQTVLTNYQQAQKIVATEERMDVETTKLDQMSAELIKIRIELRNAKSRSEQMRNVLKQKGVVEEISEFQKNALVQKLKADVVKYKRVLAEISNDLGESHPKYQAARLQLTEAERNYQREVNAFVNGVSNAVALTRERVRAQEQAVERQKTRVLELKGQRNKITVLSREVESTQRVYDAALERANNTQMESLVSQANVSLMESAFVSSKPSSPKIKQNIFLAFVLGGLFGVGLAFLTEMIDRRIRTRDDIEEDLGIPVLGVLGKA